MTIIQDKKFIPNLLLSEDFRDEFSVLNNGLSIVGSPIISNGLSGLSNSDYLSISNSKLRCNPKCLSVSMDVSIPSGVSGYKGIWAWGAEWRLFYYDSTNKLYLRYQNSVGTTIYCTIDMDSLLDTKITITFTIYELAGNEYSRLYVNDLSFVRSNPGTLLDPNGDIWIGNSSAISGFSGTIYSCQIFNRVLTQEDHNKLRFDSYTIVQEDFIDDASVTANGFTIVGSPTIDNGINGFSASDYVTVPDLGRYPTSVSFWIRCTINTASAATSRILGSSISHADTIRTYSDGTNIYIYLLIGGTVRNSYQINITTFIGTGTEIELGWSFKYDGANTTIYSYLNGVYIGSLGPYAGAPTLVGDVSLGYWAISGAIFDGEIKKFGIFETAVSETEFSELYAGNIPKRLSEIGPRISKELQSHKNTIILPGNSTYDNNSGDRVTSAISSIGVNEVIMGDGSTPSTFPALSNKMFEFDDTTKYINCGNMGELGALPSVKLREKFVDAASVAANGFTIVGSPTINNGASGFSSANYISFNYNFPTSFSLLLKFTVSDSATTWERILSSLSEKLRLFWYHTTDNYSLGINVDGTDRYAYSGNVSSFDGKYISLGFGCYFDGVNTTLKGYVNGELVDTKGPYPGSFNFSDNPLKIGTESVGSPFSGTIKELQIYDEVLSAADFEHLHNDFYISINEPFSIGCLFKYADLTDDDYLLTKGQNSTIGEYLLQYKSGEMRFFFVDNTAGGSKYLRGTVGPVLQNHLHFLVVTYDGTGTISTDTCRLYLDNVNILSLVSTFGTFNSIQRTAYPLLIGIDDDMTNFYDGKISFPFLKKGVCLSPLQVEILNQQVKRWLQTP